MTWCTESDVNRLLDNIPMSSGTNRTSHMNDAEDIMNSYFYGVYEIPLTIPNTVSSVKSGATTNILRMINANLAAGQLLLSTSSVHEMDTLHSYAKDLEKKAMNMLGKIQSKKMVLVGVTQDTDLSDNYVSGFKILSSSPDGKSGTAQSSDNATDEKSYFNRPIDEVGDDSYEVDLDV